MVLGPRLFGTGSSGAAEPAVEVDPTTPVVLIILDELPSSTLMNADQEIDANRYPNIASFSSQSTWYRNNAAAGDFTAWAVPPILTGNHADAQILPTSDAQPDNIFNLLGPGRKVHSHEEVTELCSRALCPDGHQGEAPDETDSGEFVKAKFKLINIPEINRWIGTMPAGGRTLSVLHLILPHEPLQYLPKGQKYPGGPLYFTVPRNHSAWSISDAGISLAQQRHMMQVGYADRLVGRVMKKIRSNGAWDRSMVVLTADHGDSFGNGQPRRDARPGNIAATLNPPLMIKYPGQQTGEISRKATQAIDIVPTIAEVLGVKNMYSTDGQPIDQLSEDREMFANKYEMEKINFSTSDIRAERAGLVKTSERRLGTSGLWKLGPQSELIGTRPGRTRVLGGASVTIDSPRRLVDYKPRAGYVPSLISGELTGVEADQLVAVAVNGRITGTTRTFTYEGPMRFGTMTSPSSIRRGANRITVYAVGPTGKLRRISRA
ncbi:MAG: sulfatase-like hydrolase/transferase [Thermoleophilia bacterium]|nr:sulfatase-like hydrolase/transferase [Thermoleophilia bacterium]